MHGFLGDINSKKYIILVTEITNNNLEFFLIMSTAYQRDIKINP